MNIVNRIKRFINVNNLSLSEFDRSISVANGYIGKQIKTKGSVGSHIIEKIISVYPHLNVLWLMTGKGDMFYAPEINTEKSGGTLEEDKGNKSDSQDFSLVNIGEETADLIVKTFQLQDTSLRMGNEINLLEGVDSDEDNFQSANDFTCVRYKGDGMLPTISHGTYMISKKVDKQDWPTAEDSYMYIVSSTKGVFIGRLVNRLEEGYLLLLKNSPDKKKHPDVRINIWDLESIWNVKGYILSPEQSIYQPEALSAPISTIEEKLKGLLKEVEKIKSELHTTKPSDKKTTL